MRDISKKRKRSRKISAARFDEKFERGENIFPYLDFKKARAVKRVNVDFPVWMAERLDQEAVKLNVSRQAVIKMWIHDRLSPASTHRPLR